MTRNTLTYLSRRKSIYGIGINDADYVTNPKINGKRPMCPFYRKWINIFVRCYSLSALKTRPTYIDCSVAEEWHYFMTFRAWMMNQDWEGKELDKDILIPDNKIYSPETCCFVSSDINKILNKNSSLKDSSLKGIYFDKFRDKYEAQISKYGKNKRIGYFDTLSEAKLAYKKERSKYIREIAMTQPQRIKEGLLKHAVLYETGNY